MTLEAILRSTVLGRRCASLTQRLRQSQLVRSVVQTLGTRGVTIGVGLLTSVVIARALGPAGRGSFAVAMAITAIGVQFGNLGLHASNTYVAARDATLLPALTANSLAVSAGLGAVIASLVIAVSAVAPAIIPVHGLPLAIALAGIPVGLALLLLQNLLLGVHDVTAFNKLELLARGTTLVVTATVIAVGAISVSWMLSASLLATGTAAFAGAVYLRRHLKARPRLSRPIFSESLAYGLRAYFAALMSFLVLRVDLLMVQHYLGEEQTGYYSIAVALADMLYMVPAVIGTLLFPRLTALREDVARRRLTLRAAVAVAALMAFLTGLGMALARPAVLLLYGDAFLPAVPAFTWLAPGIALLGVHTIFMNYLASVGMPLVTVWLPLGALAVNVVLNALLLPGLGIRGASLSSVSAYGLMMLVGIGYVLIRRPRQHLTAVA